LKTTDFSEKLTAFLEDYLPYQRNFSNHTIASYCYTFKLFLRFCASEKKLNPQKIKFKDITLSLITDFLAWLETDQKCGIATRNLRLAAIHSFIEYSSSECPQNLLEFIKIQDLPHKKTIPPTIEYLSPEDMELILKQPDTKTKAGRRHLAVLCVLYDSGCRVSEITGLTVRGFRQLQEKIIVLGKGKKMRELPLQEQTITILNKYIEENRLNTPNNQSDPLLRNHSGGKISRAGVTYIVKKYTEMARNTSKTIPEKVTPHIFRHSRAMHMLMAGVPLHVIQDILGHVDISTTQRYAKANLQLKKAAIESVPVTKTLLTEKNYDNEPNISEWLTNYARECNA
jgi:site-specific recombinase XerD